MLIVGGGDLILIAAVAITVTVTVTVIGNGDGDGIPRTHPRHLKQLALLRLTPPSLLPSTIQPRR